MRKREKKSRYFGQFVKAIRKINGHIQIREGILRGYLGSYVLIDTGDFFYEQFPIGTAPGRWLVMPAKTKIEIRDTTEIDSIREMIAKHASVRKAVEEETWQLDSDFSQNDWMLDENPSENEVYNLHRPEFGEDNDDCSVTEWQFDLESLPAFYPVTASMDVEAYNDL